MGHISLWILWISKNIMQNSFLFRVVFKFSGIVQNVILVITDFHQHFSSGTNYHTISSPLYWQPHVTVKECANDLTIECQSNAQQRNGRRVYQVTAREQLLMELHARCYYPYTLRESIHFIFSFLKKKITRKSLRQFSQFSCLFGPLFSITDGDG